MSKKWQIFMVWIFSIPLVLLSQVNTVRANQFTPYNEIAIEVHSLDFDGNITGICTDNPSAYGCTAWYEPESSLPLPDEKKYLPNTHIITLDYETEYLLNVVAQEVGNRHRHPTAYSAQAIAARTYGYFHLYNESVEGGDEILNNSTIYQAYIPNAFDKFGVKSNGNPSNGINDPVDLEANPASTCNERDKLSDVQKHICDGVQNHRLYLTTRAANTPILAMYASDSIARTAHMPLSERDENNVVISCDFGLPSGYRPNRSVADPISQAPYASNNGHDFSECPEGDPFWGKARGMSQNGASRWSHGNEDHDGVGTPDTIWSVRWQTYDKTLFHYYSGVVLREFSGAVISPANRWNILEVNWRPEAAPGIVHEEKIPYQSNSLDGTLSLETNGTQETFYAQITIQNTGETTWGDCSQMEIRYSWARIMATGVEEVDEGKIPLDDCGGEIYPGNEFVESVSIKLPPPILGENIPYMLEFDLAAPKPIPSSATGATYMAAFSWDQWHTWQFRTLIDCPSFSACTSESDYIPLLTANLMQGNGVWTSVNMRVGDDDLDIELDAPLTTEGLLTISLYDAETDTQTILDTIPVSAGDVIISVPLVNDSIFDGAVHELSFNFVPGAPPPTNINLQRVDTAASFPFANLIGLLLTLFVITVINGRQHS